MSNTYELFPRIPPRANSLPQTDPLQRFRTLEGLTADVNQRENSAGYVLDVNRFGENGLDLKVAEDGQTILIPQPSHDTNDPLNWTQKRKNLILLIISILAFFPDFNGSMAIVTLLPQAKNWRVSQNTMERTFSDTLFCLAAGSLLSVMFSSYFGRLPILTLFSAISLGTCAWSAAATSQHSFLAARVINGVFSIVAQACGLMYIQDIFYLHEHARKINLWSGAVIISPHLGPLFSSFIVYYKHWQDAYWLSTAVAALCFILIICLMDETIYNRGLFIYQQFTPRHRFLRLLGREQWAAKRYRPTFLQACMRPFIAISKIPVLLCVVFYFLNFSWIIGTNASIAIFLTKDYHFTTYNLGMFYFAPIVGSLLGTITGHWLHHKVSTIYVKRHGGKIEPEARLVPLWVASPLMAICLLIVGIALHNKMHWSVVAVFFAGQVMGINIATVALGAYLLDSYPEGSGDVGAWLTAGRATGGCMATYIQLDWVARSGYLSTFAAQTGITAGSALIILGLGFCGKYLRKQQGRMTFPGQLTR